MSVPGPPSTNAESSRAQRLELAASRRLTSIRLVLEHLEDRGNRAAILRTAESLGLLHVDEVASVDPERGRARGVAHGGEKWLCLHAHSTPAECRAACAGYLLLAALPPPTDVRGVSESWHSTHKRRRHGGPTRTPDDAPPDLFAAAQTDVELPPPVPLTSPLTPIPLEEVDFSRPTALVFGNEKLGVSAELLALCDGAFTIPMYGLTESLNVSVAASIAIHHGRVARMAALRQSGELNQHGGDLSAAAVEELLAIYLGRGRDFAKGSSEAAAVGAAAGPAANLSNSDPQGQNAPRSRTR